MLLVSFCSLVLNQLCVREAGGFGESNCVSVAASLQGDVFPPNGGLGLQ